VQTILLTSSLLIVFAMVASLAWLAAARMRSGNVEAVPAERRDES
jgi:hypothetical protein